MNRDGSEWSKLDPEPEGRDSNVDCRASDSRGRYLDMQVTRLSPPGLWSQVKSNATVSVEWLPLEALNFLRQAIEGKRNFAAKSDIHLVIDATQTPNLAFTQVADRFRSENGEWARSLGYQAIWLVGTVEDLVHRLDI
jgi:hypothetical protein